MQLLTRFLKNNSKDKTKIKIDCLPVFWINLLAPNTPTITPSTVQRPSHNPLGISSFPLNANEIALAADEYITRNMEVEDATNGGYPKFISIWM